MEKDKEFLVLPYIHMRQNNEVAVGERVKKVGKRTMKKE